MRRRDLRIPIPNDFERRLTGRTVLRLERRAKYILGFLDSEDVLIAHLGMSGRLFGYRPDDPKRPTAAENTTTSGSTPTEEPWSATTTRAALV